MPEIGVRGNELFALFVLPVESFAEDQHVVAPAEGVSV